MLQYEKDGVVFTIPDMGKMLRIKGQDGLISKAADYKGKVPEYEEVDPNEEASDNG